MTTQIYQLWVAIIVMAAAFLFLAVVLALPDLKRLAVLLRSRRTAEVASEIRVPLYDLMDGDVSQGVRDSRQTLHDGLMDIADATAGDYYAVDPPRLTGFTDAEVETLRRNYLPLTDDERFQLDLAFQAIAQNAEGA